MYVISLVFSFVICFIILVVSMSGVAWPGACRLLPSPRVVVADIALAHTHKHTRGYQNKLLPNISDLKPKMYG